MQSGVKATETGDWSEFSHQAGGFGVMVLVPYAGGRAIAYVRGPRVPAEPPGPGAAAVPELPGSLPQLLGGRAGLPPVEVPPELLPITDSVFRTLYNEVTGTPAPVRQMQVLEGAQAGVEGAPSTAASGQPAVTNLPGLNTTPIPAGPNVPPPGVCGLPRALGGAVDATTGALPEGPISVVSGGFRLRNAADGLTLGVPEPHTTFVMPPQPAPVAGAAGAAGAAAHGAGSGN